jgi:DNA-directed RNA polymerase specialized sigma24 family protein
MLADIESDIDNQILDLLKNLPVKYRDVFLLKYSA